MVCYDNIPEELKALNQWVCALDGTKVPMRAWENNFNSHAHEERDPIFCVYWGQLTP